MASEFPRSPKTLKGALVIFEGEIPIPTNVVVFQYNPEKVTRRIGTRRTLATGGSGSGSTTGSGAGREVRPPTHSLEMKVEIDATDQLEFPSEHPLAVATGIHGVLAALELLLYPPSDLLILNKALSLVGTSVLRSARSPLVLLVWGAPRVIPVKVKGLRVEETAFDALLNPIRADVTLSLEALSLEELREVGGPVGALGLVNHIAKEALARAAGPASVVEFTAGLF